MPSIPTVALKDGIQVPVLGYGTGTAWYKDGGSSPLFQELVDVTKVAIDRGYRHLDAAEAYGTEEELAVAVKESGVPRDQLFITTKVVENIHDVLGAIATSLKKLQLYYVDLYLIHSPYFASSDEDLQKAWKNIEDVLRSGKAKAIGISSFLRPHVEVILKVASIKPVVNQIEFHPYVQRANNYVPWLQEQGIVVQSYFGLAVITWAKGRPLDPVLSKIARRHDADQSAVLFRWQLNYDVISISTTKKPERLDQYLAALDLQLTNEEQKKTTEVGLMHHSRIRLLDKFNPEDRS